MIKINARKTNTFKDIQEYYFRIATHMVAKSVCVMIVALNEEFGFGKERLSRLVERYKKINRHLNDYQDENRSDAEIRNRMSELGLQEFGDAIMATHHIERYRQEAKRLNSADVSIKEAAEAQKNLKKMMELMKR